MQRFAKLLPFIVLGMLPRLLFSQVQISGAFVLWKDHFTSFKAVRVVISSGDDTLFSKQFAGSVIPERGGQYPVSFFEFVPDETGNELQLEFSLSGFANPTNDSQWSVYKETCPINHREGRIEMEFHLQKYGGFDGSPESEGLEEISIKKYYQPDTSLLFLTLGWNPKTGNAPAYKITNNTPFQLYGQGEDGRFYARLYKHSGDSFQRVYTGGYDYTEEPGAPLYASTSRMSWIPDESQDSLKFHVTEKGKYIYQVLVGFDAYELSSRYGEEVYFKAGHQEADAGRSYDFTIKEYYVLEVEFEI